jgi:hypothetical protein
MKRQGAEALEVPIPHQTELLKDGYALQRQDFKFDFNSYLEAHPTAPVRSLEEVLTLKKYHPSLQQTLTASQAANSRDSKEYLA